MRASRAATAPSPKAPTALARASQLDSRLVTAALVSTVGVLIVLRSVVHPQGDPNWTYQVAMLCLVVTVGVGRALLADRGEPAEVKSTARRPERLLVPLVFLAAILPYLPSLAFGFFSDDFSFNENVTRLHSPWAAFTTRVFMLLYRPLHIAAWWLEHRLWGDAPLGYHAVSIALHGLNAVLVYLLAKRLTRNRTTALLAGVLFGLHPLHTEAVVWASCQIDVQATFLALLSLLCLDSYLDATHRGPRGAAFVGACGCFALAAFTKESAVALPGMAVLWVVYRLGRRGWRPALLVAGAYAFILVGYLMARLAVLKAFGGYYTISTFWNTWFPTAPLRQMQAFFFPINQELCNTLPWALGRVLVPVLVALMGAFLLICARRAASLPWSRLAFYAGSMAVLTVPVWQLPSPSASLEGARFGYLPTVALVWLVAEALTAPRHLTRWGARVPALMVAGAAVLCLWYLMPWHTAQGLVRSAVQAAVEVIRETPQSTREPVFFMKSLPDATAGAQVFRNGFPQAVQQALGRRALVETVSSRSGIPQEVLALTTLEEGEYLYEWRYQPRGFVLVRRGGADARGGGR